MSTIHGTGKRFGCNVILAITNRGRLLFTVFKRCFMATVFPCGQTSECRLR